MCNWVLNENYSLFKANIKKDNAWYVLVYLNIFEK